MENKDLNGFRVWEVLPSGSVVKIKEGTMKELEDGTKIFDFDELDLDNKTYAIRIGKRGLQ